MGREKEVEVGSSSECQVLLMERKVDGEKM